MNICSYFKRFALIYQNIRLTNVRLTAAGETGGKITATADSAYEGVDMTRTLELEETCLKDRFICKSDSCHTYDYTLILREPLTFPDSQRDTLPEYERISKVRKTSKEGNFSFSTSDGTVVSLDIDVPYELFTGTAPGIPPSGLEQGKDVYPLIIRIKGRVLDIKASWKFVEPESVRNIHAEESPYFSSRIHNIVRP